LSEHKYSGDWAISHKQRMIISKFQLDIFIIAKFIERVLDAKIAARGLPWLGFKQAKVRTGRRKSRLIAEI
jgi:hypothetical protein